MQYVPNTVPGFSPDFFGAGKHGFQDGNPSGGIQGTLLAAALLNDMLGNLMKACELGTVATAAGQYTDIANAITGIAALPTAIAINNYQIVGGDSGKLLSYGTGAAALTTSLPNPAGLSARFAADLRCDGPYPLTVNAFAGTTIEGQASISIGAGETVFFVLIGTDWKTRRQRSGRYAPGWQLSSLSYSHTVQPGVSVLTSVLWGGGGSGAPGGGTPGNGGGPGGFSLKRCIVKPGDVIAVTVGQGGAPGGTNAGGSSSFGSFHSATGGAHDQTPGIGVGGDVNFGGAAGSQAASGIAGNGGGAPFGGGGSGPGQGGQVPGGGGGGAVGFGSAGGAHGASLVIW